MRVKLLEIAVLVMTLLSSCLRGNFACNDDDDSLFPERIGFNTPNKDFCLIQYISEFNCDDFVPNCRGLGNEWSPAISESEEETDLLRATLNYVVDHEGGYSVCGNERRNGVPRPIVISDRARTDSEMVYGELCEKDKIPNRVAFFTSDDLKKSYSVIQQNLALNCVERDSECTDLGDEWSLAIFRDMAETDSIKSGVQFIVGGRAGFHICGKLMQDKGPFPVYISDLAEPGAEDEQEIVYGELCEKDLD